MTRIILIAAAAIGLIGTIVTADAQSRYRQAPVSASARVEYVPAGVRRPKGPPWAMPNECYIDEGFGRFSSCR